MVRFLDTDSSGTVDVGEVDKAVREFRDLVRDRPSLGTGPMTVIDSAEIDRLARRTFTDLVAKHSSSGMDNKATDADGDAATTNNEKNEKNDDENGTTVGSTIREGGGHGVEVLPAATTAAAATEGVSRDTDQGAAGEGDVNSDDEKQSQQQQTVSVSEISEAFQEALRQSKDDGEGQHSVGHVRRPGPQQPSTDTQHAQVPRPSLQTTHP